MNKHKSCKHILLAKNEAGGVSYCERCDVVELEIGAVSLRVNADDLHYVSQLLKDADLCLHYFRLDKDRHSNKKRSAVEPVH